jgi:putative MATE family efflux protein
MQDMTTGSPLKHIVLFTIPLIIGNLFQQLYNISDTLVVGQTLGVNSLAAVGATGSLAFLILGFVQGFSSGMSIITAQRFGADDTLGVRKSYIASIWGGLIITIITTAVSLAFIHPLLVIMQTPTEIFAQAQLFIVIIIIGIFSTMAYNIVSNALRALGDARTPLYVLIAGMIINLTVELALILVFGWGVDGAAWATVLAQVMSVVFAVLYINRRMPTLAVGWQDLRFDREEVMLHLRTGVPLGFQQSIIAIGSVTLATALNTLGTEAVAANTAASKIDQIIIWVLMSFGVTMATYVAQNYGAQKYDRILQGVSVTLKLSVAIALVLGLLEILFGRYLVGLFISGNAAHVVELAQIFFWVNGPMYWLLALLFILRYTLQGLGDVKTPTLAGFGELVSRTVAAFALVLPFGFLGASMANPLAFIGSLLFLIPAYRRAVKLLKQNKPINGGF